MLRAIAASPKPRVVVLGSGWGGFALAKHLNPALFDVTVVSPRNHMLFTVRKGSDAPCSHVLPASLWRRARLRSCG